VAGSADVAVLELAGGSVTLSGPGGQSLQLPVDELDKRLAQQTHGAVSAVRLVTVRSGGRWRVDLLASAAEQARLAARGGQPDYQLLAGTAPGKGAASPDAAVRGLAAAVAADPTSAIDWLAPDERAVAAAYRAALLARRPELGLRPGNLRVRDLRLRDEPVAAQVVRVRLLGGQLLLRGLPGAPSSVPLDRAGRQAGATPYVVAVQRGGAWYPSLEFTAADWLVSHPPTRERP
jgi:hypothetical protein